MTEVGARSHYFFATGAAQANVVYDPTLGFAAGWTSDANPNGDWSYGYSSTVTGAVTLFTGRVAGADSSNQLMWISPAYNCCLASPSVGFNNGFAFNDGNVGQAADQIDMVSSVYQNLATDLVFTAPHSGTYSLTSSFIGDQYGIGVGVDVVLNGSVLFSSSVSSFGQVVPYDSSLTLNTGNILEFVVTQGSGDQNTGLDVQLAASGVPEPSTWTLLTLGVIGVGLTRYRASRKSFALPLG